MTAAIFLPEDGQSTTKAYLRGTHRQRPPAETVARVRQLMPVMGITRIANVTGLDFVGVPVVMVTRPNSRSLVVSQGKGLDLDAAKASSLMESVESYHAEHITLPLKLGSYEDLRFSHSLADVAQLPRHSDSVFRPNTQLLWIEGQDLMGGDPAWLPYELVHLNYTLPLPTGHGCFKPSSNGLASGNHILEAISHGVCEVVERDATTLWHLLDGEAKSATRVDLDSIDDANCRFVLDKLEAANIWTAVWETTSDVGIPAFLCRIIERTDNPSHLLRPAAGMGCHSSKEAALLRALTEAVQSRLTFISGSRDDLDRGNYDRFLDADTRENWRTSMEVQGEMRSFTEISSRTTETFEDDVEWEIGRLKAAGIEQVLAIELTKEEFGLPVVRVVIPGLESVDDSPKYVHRTRAQRLRQQLQ